MYLLRLTWNNVRRIAETSRILASTF